MMDFLLQGLQHPLVMPAHLLVLIAVGLFAGQQGGRSVAVTLIALIVSLAIGAITTLFIRVTLDLEVALLVTAMLCGVLVVLRLQLPIWIPVLCALFAGLLVGLDSAAPKIPGLRGSKIYALLGGTVFTAATLGAVCSLIALALRQFLEGVPLRVLGAWISAGALLVLTLFLTKTMAL